MKAPELQPPTKDKAASHQPKPRPDESRLSEILRTLDLLRETDDLSELRVLGANGREETFFGYYRDRELMARAALHFSGHADGVYLVLNRIHDGLYARSPDAMTRATRQATATSDRDVLRRRWLPVDFDPLRPSGISSTDEERAAAFQTVGECWHWLVEQGWPQPVVGDSGNGYHLLFAVELPNDEAATRLVKGCLEALAVRFNNDKVEIDPKNFNAARIWKLYGTQACKGIATPDRPHRMAKLLHVPDVMLHAVSRELLEKLATEVSQPKQGQRPHDDDAVDQLRQWLLQHGQEIVREEEYQDGYRFQLTCCPFNPDHKGAAVFIGGDGRKGFHCFHKSCDSNQWCQLSQLLEPEAANSRQNASGRRPGRGNGGWKDPQQTQAALTEERLAQQFEAEYRERLKFDHDRGRWYVYDEERGYWREDKTRRAYHYAREVCRNSNIENAKEFARARTYGGVEQICQKSPIFAVTSDHWNRDIWLLGTPGGTVDLRSGTLRPARKDDYISKQTAVAPDFHQEKPVFTKFFAEITQDDAELQRYLQRLAGYSLTGSTKEEKLFFPFGTGGNGKSKFFNAIAATEGDYHVVATMEAFVEKRGERHTTDIAALAGARLVTASETQKSRHWDEALITRLTGGDPITARLMRHDNFTYTPQFTLIIIGNHTPELGSVNEANRRRFVIIPFAFQPEEADEELADKLRPEYPAILAWMINGARDWYQHGLGEMPEVVRDETVDYFETQNDVLAWIDECCLVGRNYTGTSATLFHSWSEWCKRNGMTPGSHKELIQTLKKQHRCKKNRSARARGLTGIAVKVEYKPDPRTGERQDD
jgi:putative DNA primase/helicase